jgi:SNF2 family DNA or RNA helicase
MGLGKTAQAIVFANAVGAQRVLVVCPSAVVINWCREIAAWATDGRCKILSKVKPNTPTPDVGWNVVNYDKLGLSGFGGIHNTEWDLVIFDESHYIKNHKAKRTKAALNISASFRLFLTGTPVLNRPVELWTTVNACAPGLFAHRQAYVVKFCDAHMGRWGWDESGASNLDELQTTLRSTIMVRRHKAAVLDDLPPKTRQVLPLEGEGAAVKKAKRLWSQAVDTFGLEHAAERLSGQPVGFESFSEVRRAVGLAKVPAVVQHVLEVVESDAKVLVFAHHKDVAKAIYDGLTTGGVQAVLATGETAVEGRQKAVDAFQTDGRIKVFVGTIGAVGAGITLTEASVVVFAELPLVPGLVEQAEDRAHRIGQRGAVLVQYLVYDGTIDAHVARILVKKEKVIRSAC